MDRYRSYSSLDDPPITAGDDAFVGVNSWDAAENLEPGQVQDAVNMDFSSQDAKTRGGFVCIPALGLASFNVSSPWTSRTIPNAENWFSVTYANGRFVAVDGQTSAGTNDVMYSIDGITWTVVSSGIAKAWRSITYGNGSFVAVSSGGSSRVMTSTDGGVTWTSRTPANTSYSWSSVTYGNGLFVAVAVSGGGSTTDQVMTSPDGITWTLRTGTPDTGGFGWNWVTYGNGVFVAVRTTGFGTAGPAMYSSDGITWTSPSGPSNSWTAIAFDGTSTFCAVGSSGGSSQAMTSSDGGQTWTQRTTISGGSYNWNAITWGAGQFVAVNSTGTAASAIMTSPNGINWTAATAPSTALWFGVAYGNGTFVATPSAASGAAVMTKSYYTTPSTTGAVLASGVYSDPNDAGSQWIMLVGTNTVGFYAFGKTSRSVAIDSSYTVTEQSTVVQCNNQVYIFRGPDSIPLYWTGDWGTTFTAAPTPTPSAGFSIIPNSNQATYYQNRLWVVDGKDTIAASDVLDFTAYDDLANSFNLNTGDSNYLVTTYPFGTATLLVFKNRSILALTSVDGALGDVTATEITRQVGCIGINAVVSVGPDVVYMSDRNINLISLTDTNNSLQHQTLPLSRNIQSVFKRVNWSYAYKVSMGYNDNKLYVALPLDNSTVCNTVVVYNFVTQQWFGEWNFSSLIGMAIQNWVVANYLGVQRMHCVTEDGRIFVTDEGQQDISGTTVAEITASLTTRAYVMDNNNRVNRRMWADLGTWRPNFTVTAYVDGASESSTLLSGQTFSRSQSWIFGDSTYSLTNSGDDYNRSGRKDYAGLCSDSIQPQSGFKPEMLQEYRMPLMFRRSGRLVWFKIENTQGSITIKSIGGEARPGERSNRVEVI